MDVRKTFADLNFLARPPMAEHLETSHIDNIVKKIQNDNTPISMRMRCLFLLRGMDDSRAASAIQKCISGTSVLLDHEVAYVLGQMRQHNTMKFLLQLATDARIHPIVRHEAIEALGNFGESSLDKNLRPFLDDECRIVRESAMLAINKLKHGKSSESIYGSHDPALAHSGSFESAKAMLEKGDLIEKYNAIFYLRDQNTREAVEVLSEGFKDDSALLRHEVAFVFGQMQNPDATDILINVLSNEMEEEIVRHEAAEALGNIGTDKAKEFLRRYLSSNIRILKESAEVGLGIAEYPEDEYFEVNIENQT